MSKSGSRPRRNIKPEYRVFCEGETEQAYIDVLRQHYRVNIQLISYKLHLQIKSNQISKFKIGKAERSVDKDFMMYDGDRIDVLEKLFNIKNVTLLISTPCIELWFLLHIKNVTQQVDTAWCIKELNKRFKYQKGCINNSLAQNLLDNISKACKRAKKMKLYDNPSSSIYKLIDELEKLKSK